MRMNHEDADQTIPYAPSPMTLSTRYVPSMEKLLSLGSEKDMRGGEEAKTRYCR